MKKKIHPIFPETIVQYNLIGIDQKELQKIYEEQEWQHTNSDDDPEKFLKISKNSKVLDKYPEIKNVFVEMVNEYAAELMLYTNRFRMTTSWFTKTEKNRISTLHNHGNAVISAVYYFGLASNKKSRITFENLSSANSIYVHPPTMLLTVLHTFLSLAMMRCLFFLLILSTRPTRTRIVGQDSHWR